MATFAAASSAAALNAVSSGAVAAAASVGAFRPLLYPASFLTAARDRQARRRLLPPSPHLSAARRSPGPLRLVAAFSPHMAPLTETTSVAAASAASWVAAAFTHGPHAAAAALPTLSASAMTAARLLLELARVVAERMGADLSAPWTAVVAGAGRCLDLYREIMLVRCLLTWFPNVPWERQPFSALRDLCDPFLRLFQRIVPPVFGSRLDISSLLVFTALGVLARIMNPPNPAAF